VAISKQIVYIGDFADEAAKMRDSFGRTDRFSTGHSKLDEYLGHGFGRKDGYEVVLLYGATGIGKSLVALNFLAQAIIAGEQVGLMILEDDMADASLRLSYILGPSKYEKMNAKNNVRCIPRDALMKSWRLDDLLAMVEEWFDAGIEVILLDHLQFAFEGAESIKGENEYVAQRVFMQKLNQLMKKNKKTIILVSHVNKDNGSKGMNKIVGSGAIAQAATKVIEVGRDKDNGDIVLHMRKSRFTRTPGHDYHMKFIGTKMESAL
jgi:predicted ATP-dependent serine protease